MDQLPIGRFYLPATMPPLHCEIESWVVIGKNVKKNELHLEQRLPLGETFNPQNPAHILAWFYTVAADKLLPHALIAWQQNEALRTMLTTAQPVNVLEI